MEKNLMKNKLLVLLTFTSCFTSQADVQPSSSATSDPLNKKISSNKDQDLILVIDKDEFSLETDQRKFMEKVSSVIEMLSEKNGLDKNDLEKIKKQTDEELEKIRKAIEGNKVIQFKLLAKKEEIEKTKEFQEIAQKIAQKINEQKYYSIHIVQFDQTKTKIMSSAQDEERMKKALVSESNKGTLKSKVAEITKNKTTLNALDKTFEEKQIQEIFTRFKKTDKEFNTFMSSTNGIEICTSPENDQVIILQNAGKATLDKKEIEQKNEQKNKEILADKTFEALLKDLCKGKNIQIKSNGKTLDHPEKTLMKILKAMMDKSAANDDE